MMEVLRVESLGKATRPGAPLAEGQLWSGMVAEELHRMATQGLRTLVRLCTRC